MNITVSTTQLRPSTMANMIADLMDMPSPDNLPVIKALLAQLEAVVGEEESIEWIVDAGVTPEQIIEMWNEVDA